MKWVGGAGGAIGGLVALLRLFPRAAKWTGETIAARFLLGQRTIERDAVVATSKFLQLENERLQSVESENARLRSLIYGGQGGSSESPPASLESTLGPTAKPSRSSRASPPGTA